MQQQNTALSRLNLNNARDVIQAGGGNPDKVPMTQSFLRLENQLVVGKTQFGFQVQQAIPNESGIVFNTEKRLKNSDSFFVNSMGILLSSPASNIDAEIAFHTYPNLLAFPVGLAHLEVIYNSELTMGVGNTILVPSWDVARHRKVPVTQSSVTLKDQVDGSDDGFVPVEPNWILIGNKNYVFTLKMPAALAAVDAFLRMTIYLRGLLVTDSTINA